MKTKKTAVICAAAAVSLALCGCNANVNDITEDEKNAVRSGINSFSAELFKEEYSKNNTKNNLFLSPISVYTGLSLSVNGANGDTENQLTKALSGGFFSAETNDTAETSLDEDTLNRYFSYYIKSLRSSNSKAVKLGMANSVWTIKRDDINMRKDFIDIGKRYYGAEIFNIPFENSSVERINKWVLKKTDNMINADIGDNLTEDSMAVLINAMAFDSKWQVKYSSESVNPRDFNNYDGSVSKVEFMSSTEERYIDDDHSLAIIKDYHSDANNEKRYAFVAILPNKDVGIDEYIEKYFTADTFKDGVNNSYESEVHAKIPKFEFECTYNLGDDLKALGIKSAFDEKEADFSGMADIVGENSDEKNIYLNDVVHKTYISVDEEGTKAKTYTGFGFSMDLGAMAVEEIHITLDRPFIFAIYDYKEQVPVFIGTVNDL